jgi:hypothetical protein
LSPTPKQRRSFTGSKVKEELTDQLQQLLSERL